MSQEKIPIEKAETIASTFYTDPTKLAEQIEKIFCKSWQYVGDQEDMLSRPENLFPFVLLPGAVNEPLLFSKDGDTLRLLSNVCTHRGFVMITEPKKARVIACGYHGRQFNSDGTFKFMPEFKEVENFPRPCDNLHEVKHDRFSRFLFANLSDGENFDHIKKRLDERLYFLDFDAFRSAKEYNQVYNVHAHWALYIDNYLEGFHIPFVHDTLGNMIDYGTYTTECYDDIVLQIGLSNGETLYFDLPEGHPDYGKKVTGYYYWVYPNFMMNIYPWGVQLNIIKPISTDFTKVEFLYFIKDEKAWEIMGKDRVAEKTEREDEYVVESVQNGLKSRFYDTGRYSATRETGVYYFHSLVRDALDSI